MVESIQNANVENATDRFTKSQFVVLGQRGVYQIEGVEFVDFGATRQECFLLTKVFSKSIHKTFVPIKNIKRDQMREIATEEEVRSLEGTLFNVGFDLADIKLNSIKKIDFYNQIIRKDKFYGLVQAFIAISVDLDQTAREEKKLRQYCDKLRAAICEEISFVMNIATEDCEKMLRRFVAMFASL